MASLPRKTVLITGCSAGGIGSALAKAFHAHGLRVIATARDLPKIEHLKAMGIDVLTLDIEDAASIKTAVIKVAALTGGTLDILVNNSGVVTANSLIQDQAGPIIDSDLAYTRKMFEVNVFGRIAITQAFVAFVTKSKGIILNIGSIAGVCPQPWKGMYNASCAAVHLWSDTLRIEMAPFGVRVLLVVTGAVRTNFITNQPSVKLANESIYMPAKESIEAVMNATAVAKNFIDADVYARQVVENVLRKSPVKIQWAGGVANLIRLASAVLWSTAWDFLLAKQFGINDLNQNLQTASAKT